MKRVGLLVVLYFRIGLKYVLMLVFVNDYYKCGFVYYIYIII